MTPGHRLAVNNMGVIRVVSFQSSPGAAPDHFRRELGNRRRRGRVGCVVYMDSARDLPEMIQTGRHQWTLHVAVMKIAAMKEAGNLSIKQCAL